MDKPRILLIIPAYNEEDNILEVYKCCQKKKEILDAIVINDGSRDNTLKMLVENNIPHVNLIQNVGIGGAVQTGYKYAYRNGYDIAVQFDGDEQHNVEYVERLTALLEDGYDMKLMFRQMGIAALVVLAFIVPWSVRNYIRFDHFIPLTYGAGNPKLLGSYQGDKAPLDEELDYQTNVYDKMPAEMKKYYADDGTLRPEYEGDGWYEDYMAAYYALELDGMKADYRISV